MVPRTWPDRHTGPYTLSSRGLWSAQVSLSTRSLQGDACRCPDTTSVAEILGLGVRGTERLVQLKPRCVDGGVVRELRGKGRGRCRRTPAVGCVHLLCSPSSTTRSVLSSSYLQLGRVRHTAHPLVRAAPAVGTGGLAPEPPLTPPAEGPLGQAGEVWSLCRGASVVTDATR